MKKIMFNDKYGLTQAVLGGRKTMTRRIMKPQPTWVSGDWRIYNDSKKPTYNIGEVVAIAQPYKNIHIPATKTERFYNVGLDLYEDAITYESGWTNKMFVKADLMPHHIRITDIKIERLQDISDEDCCKEGVIYIDKSWCKGYKVENLWNDIRRQSYWYKPQEAFAHLIDKVLGKGTWERNPYVFAYTFELMKEGGKE